MHCWRRRSSALSLYVAPLRNIIIRRWDTLRIEPKSSHCCCVATSTRLLATQQRQQRRHLKRLAPKEINFNLVNLGKQKKWEDLLQVYQDEKTRFDDVNYSTLMSQLARIRHVDTKNATFLELVGDLPQQLKRFNARAIGSTANALAKLRVPKHKRHLTLEFFAELDRLNEILFEERNYLTIAPVSYTHLTLPTIYSV